MGRFSGGTDYISVEKKKKNLKKAKALTMERELRVRTAVVLFL